MLLKNLRGVNNCEWVLDAAYGSELLEVRSPHALTQAAGYLKYRYNSDFNIFFRGQTKPHKKMRPSLMRSCATFGGYWYPTTLPHETLSPVVRVHLLMPEKTPT